MRLALVDAVVIPHRVILLALLTGIGCAAPRSTRPTPSSSVCQFDDAGTIAGSLANTDAFPATWTQVAAGVTWRGVRIPFSAPPPDVTAWATSPNEIAWVVLRVDLSRVHLTVVQPQGDRLEAIEDDRNVLAAINGGYFEPDRTPSGLLAYGGAVFGQLNPRAGSGILTVAQGHADVWASEGLDAGSLPSHALSVQCGPRLVEQRSVVGIHRDDGRRYARSGACVRDGGHTLDLVATWDPSQPLRGPGLLQFAQMLAGPSPVGDTVGCDLALNLDGGPSTGIFAQGGLRHDAVGPTPWVIVVRP